MNSDNLPTIVQVKGLKTYFRTLDGTVRAVRDYSYSWDSPWQAGTSSDPNHWYAEIEIPWDIMELPDERGKRRLGVYLQRQVSHLGEYWALPAIPFTSQVFLAALRVAELRLPPDQGHLLMNVNTPRDHHRALRHLRNQ